MLFRRPLLLITLLCLAAPLFASADSPGVPVPVIREIVPLSIRGVNYFPQDTPWDACWTHTPDAIWERDMHLAAGLNINAVRIFLPWNEKIEQAGLIDPEGHVDPAYIQKVERFLDIAWKHGIRAMVCFSFEYREPEMHVPREAAWKRAMGTFAEHFKEDGRILMWDLMNEPERYAPPEAGGSGDFSGNESLKAYLTESVTWIKTVDPNHLTTVGLAWRIDLLAPLALPDVLQYHHYSPKEELFGQGIERVRTVARDFQKHGGDRPLLIGECGISTARDPEHGAGADWTDRLSAAPGTEDEQARVYSILFDAAEALEFAGVMPWILHSFHTTESGWLTPEESMYGMYRLDLTPKPAALLTKERYAHWREVAP